MQNLSETNYPERRVSDNDSLRSQNHRHPLMIICLEFSFKNIIFEHFCNNIVANPACGYRSASRLSTKTKINSKQMRGTEN